MAKETRSDQKFKFDIVVGGRLTKNGSFTTGRLNAKDVETITATNFEEGGKLFIMTLPEQTIAKKRSDFAAKDWNPDNVNTHLLVFKSKDDVDADNEAYAQKRVTKSDTDSL